MIIMETEVQPDTSKVVPMNEFLDWVEDVFKKDLMSGEEMAKVIIDSLTETK